MNEKKELKFKRRELITGSMAGIARQLETKIRGMAGIAEEKYLRPPGALHRDLFLMKCNKCGDCATACEAIAIRMVEKKDDENDGTPQIIPEKRPCEMCDTPLCITACPTGALTPSEDGKYKMGTASLTAACLTGKGVPCTYCYDFCPSKGDAIFQYSANQKPVIREDKCTGCGICEYYCPARPKGIFINPA